MELKPGQRFTKDGKIRTFTGYSSNPEKVILKNDNGQAQPIIASKLIDGTSGWKLIEEELKPQVSEVKTKKPAPAKKEKAPPTVDEYLKKHYPDIKPTTHVLQEESEKAKFDVDEGKPGNKTMRTMLGLSKDDDLDAAISNGEIKIKEIATQQIDNAFLAETIRNIHEKQDLFNLKLESISEGQVYINNSVQDKIASLQSTLEKLSKELSEFSVFKSSFTKEELPIVIAGLFSSEQTIIQRKKKILDAPETIIKKAYASVVGVPFLDINSITQNNDGTAAVYFMKNGERESIPNVRVSLEELVSMTVQEL